MTKLPPAYSYIVPSEEESSLLRTVTEVLDDNVGNGARLVLRDGTTVELPDSLLQAIQRAAGYLAEDLAVSIMSVHRGLTTQQAADLLDVSRPHLIQLLEQGEMPFHMVGTHRRIQLDDLFHYKRKRDEERSEGLRELTRMSQEMGLYDLPEDQS